MHIHCPVAQILDWAARKGPLHCPDPSFLGAASRLTSQWLRGRGGEGALVGGGQVPAPFGLGRA
jgi:hypothetical protein